MKHSHEPEACHGPQGEKNDTRLQTINALGQVTDDCLGGVVDTRKTASAKEGRGQKEPNDCDPG
jgi:hypothetical protein